MTQPAAASDKAGLSIALWCASAGVSRATFYAIPIASRPAHVYIGKRPIITETAHEWLVRMTTAGGVKIPRRAVKPAAKTGAA